MHGQEHPRVEASVNNYTGLLQQMGRSPQELRVELNVIGKPFGIQFGR